MSYGGNGRSIDNEEHLPYESSETDSVAFKCSTVVVGRLSLPYECEEPLPG